MIGNNMDWLDSDLVHAELTKDGSALVEVLFFFSLSIFIKAKSVGILE